LTYAADPHKKGLDRVLEAWRAIRRQGEELLVAGLEGEDEDGVRYLGRLDPEAYRTTLRRTKVFVTAPRREDYGIAQLEALADGCKLVTTRAPGPYVALRLLERIDPRAIADDEDLPGAIRFALDAEDEDWSARAAVELNAFRTSAVDRIVADELLPRLLT
jgi:glycosyltransferase involved in cell wall biosynthesis